MGPKLRNNKEKNGGKGNNKPEDNQYKICKIEAKRMKERIQRKIGRELMSELERKEANEKEKKRKREARKNLEYRLRENERDRERKRELRKNVEFRAMEKARERIRRFQRMETPKCSAEIDQMQVIDVDCFLEVLSEEENGGQERQRRKYGTTRAKDQSKQRLKRNAGRAGSCVRGRPSKKKLSNCREDETDTELLCPLAVTIKEEHLAEWSEFEEQLDPEQGSIPLFQTHLSLEPYNQRDAIIVKEERSDDEKEVEDQVGLFPSELTLVKKENTEVRHHHPLTILAHLHSPPVFQACWVSCPDIH